MLCSICNLDKDAKDFLSKNDECFKCVYKRKLENNSKKESVNRCRICEKKCSSTRWVYCSKKCAEIGELKQNQDYWIRKIKSC